VKAKAEPLPVFALSGERRQRAVRLQEPNYGLPMVDREQELAVIDGKLDLAMEGRGQFIGIVGEAGLGKSRLVAEVIRSARRKGCVEYGGDCQSDGTNMPYLAWKGIWKAFFDVDPEMPLRKLMRWLEGEIEDRTPEQVKAMPLLNAVLDLSIPDNDFTQNLEPKTRQSALQALLEDCLKASASERAVLELLGRYEEAEADYRAAQTLFESVQDSAANAAAQFALGKAYAAARFPGLFGLARASPDYQAQPQ
jgi:adenylate cyclase